MGLISDNYEQALAHHGGLEAKKFFENREPLIIRNAVCPLCGEKFVDEKEVHSHILFIHRDHQQFIKINNVVVKDFYYCEHIDTFEIAHVGDYKCKIIIDLENKSLPISEVFLQEKYIKIDVLKYVDVSSENKIKVRFINVGSTLEIIIFQRQLPEINEKGITIKLNTIQNLLNEGKDIEWNEFALFINSNNFNEVEKRYLSGFYEYYYAYYLNNKESEHHYEIAFSLLEPFVSKTQMASTAVKFICFKLNWIEKLLDLCKDEKESTFYHIAMFFTKIKYIPLKKINFIAPSEGLLITDDELDYINATIKFIEKDYEFIEEYIATGISLEGLREVIDNNLKDRIYLMLARNERRKGVEDKKHIEYYYEKIISPFYKREVEDYKNAR